MKTILIEEYLLNVICASDGKTGLEIEEDPKATFVWGRLMDPDFIKDLLGHKVCFAPAVIRGYERVPYSDFYALKKKQGAFVQGVVLLGLSEKDEAKLNEYEQVPKVMRRRRITAELGLLKRKVFFYIRASAGK